MNLIQKYTKLIQTRFIIINVSPVILNELALDFLLLVYTFLRHLSRFSDMVE